MGKVPFPKDGFEHLEEYFLWTWESWDFLKEQARANSRKRYERVGGHGYRRALMDCVVRDKGRCGICGKRLPLSMEGVDVDHIVPISKALAMGWSKARIHDLSNLQAAHHTCNQKKRDRLADTDQQGRRLVQGDFFECTV